MRHLLLEMPHSTTYLPDGPLSSTLYMFAQEPTASASCASVERGNRTMSGSEREVGKSKLPQSRRRTSARISLQVAVYRYSWPLVCDTRLLAGEEDAHVGPAETQRRPRSG